LKIDDGEIIIRNNLERIVIQNLTFSH